MNAIIRTESDACHITTADGNSLVYRPDFEPRMVEAIDDKIFTVSEQAADEMASELHAWGVPEARSLGCAVVFWS